MTTASTEESPDTAQPAGNKRGIKLAILAAAVVSVGLLLWLLPVGQWLSNFQDWVRQLGPWGPVAVVLIWIPVCLFSIPGSVITVASGAVFGVVTGSIVVSIGSTIGAACAFFVGRFVARGWIASKVEGNHRFAAIDRAVGEEGFKVVLLTRLAPVFPFNLLNYAYGLTSVKAWQYILASWIGMLPGTVMFVYLGSVFGSVAQINAEGRERTLGEQALFWLGLAATVAVVVVVTRMAKRAIDRSTEIAPQK